MSQEEIDIIHQQDKIEQESLAEKLVDQIMVGQHEPWDDDRVDDFIELLKSKLNYRMGNW